MKSIKYIIVLLSITLYNSNLKAQTISYDTCANLQQYEGEWQYVNGQDTIRIYLKAKRTLSQESQTISDNLWGWHQYKQGSTIIESNYQNRFINLPYNSDEIIDNNLCSISLQPYRRNISSNKLIGNIDDLTVVDEYHTVVAKLSNNNTVISWKQNHREGFGVFTGGTGMTLPKAFTLIKQ
jgi:hypothetical protein